MAKRFSDTNIWEKEWFLNLNLKHKILLKFLFDNCDCAGIWETNYRLATFLIGEIITEEDFLELKQVKKLENGNYIIEDFIKFQYNTTIDELNPSYSVHKGILKQLEKNKIIRVNQPLDNPSLKELQVMVMDKVKVMDMDNNNIMEFKKNEDEPPKIVDEILSKEDGITYIMRAPRLNRGNTAVHKEIMKKWDISIEEIEYGNQNKTG